MNKNIEVTITLKKNLPGLLATATVKIGSIVIHGWRVMESMNIHPEFHEAIWIQGPCIHTGKSYKEIIFIDDQELYNDVQRKIFMNYQAAQLMANLTDQAPVPAPLENGTQNEDEFPF